MEENDTGVLSLIQQKSPDLVYVKTSSGPPYDTSQNGHKMLHVRIVFYIRVLKSFNAYLIQISLICFITYCYHMRERLKT